MLDLPVFVFDADGTLSMFMRPRLCLRSGEARFGFRPLWINRAKMPDEYPDQLRPRIVAILSIVMFQVSLNV
jgi:hypothetical protein